MAYTAPTPADLRRRYPAFVGVSDDDIQYWLTDAELFVDQSWMEADYAPAIIAVAAHNMMAAGVAGLPSSSLTSLLAKGVTQFKSGTFSGQFSDEAVKQALAGGWKSTMPGQEYLLLLRRNKMGAGVTDPGDAPSCWPYQPAYTGPVW